MTFYIRLFVWVAIAAIVFGGAFAIHRGGVKSGQDDIQAKWDAAKAEAQAIQDKQTDDAANALTEEVEVIRTVYRDRIKEVIKYVPTGTCAADPDFVRLFNSR